jgi:hypothetical protein
LRFGDAERADERYKYNESFHGHVCYL